MDMTTNEKADENQEEFKFDDAGQEGNEKIAKGSFEDPSFTSCHPVWNCLCNIF